MGLENNWLGDEDDQVTRLFNSSGGFAECGATGNFLSTIKMVHEDNPDRPHQEGTVIMDVINLNIQPSQQHRGDVSTIVVTLDTKSVTILVLSFAMQNTPWQFKRRGILHVRKMLYPLCFAVSRVQIGNIYISSLLSDAIHLLLVLLVAYFTTFVNHTMLFPECRNLVIDPPENQFLDPNGTSWKAFVYCRKCYTMIGIQIVREDNPNHKYEEGTIRLHLTKTLFWNGHNMFSLMQRLPKQPQLPPHEDQRPVFLCRVCNTQFASRHGMSQMDIKTTGIFFTNYVNLAVVDTADHYFQHLNSPTRLAFVKCSRCNETLGMRSVSEDNPDVVEQQGTVGLDMTLVNIWNGSGHEVFTLMRYVPTPMILPPLQQLHQPPPPPPSPTTGTGNGHLSSAEMQQLLQSISLS
ncbi:uncharacterized protein LOC123225625 [Mangifera indica]|uniref:uncharacterized protein LOC123225625 n=1 Tax=Mangifera indica TaxID=29780 RepID=UPI001CFACC4D|nr:uncharacterized protein LOC123225625 [Mangifera indica]